MPPATSSCQHPAAEPAADRPWRRASLTGLGVFLAAKIGLAAATLFAWIGTVDPKLDTPTVAQRWATQYDSNWFIALSQNGYWDDPDAAPAAFFPLYPLLIRLATPLCLGHTPGSPRSWSRTSPCSPRSSCCTG
ncbi:hypothetical protein OHA72_16065 [Dactylosporangium sp. NBC_01737]|uniref:hypothetical protein n=1 Tax=Dactylosporangium sp. NBC_01737 TaxID=2975959 RepID=UPI002E152662|nr:hypothetical protein OHA72_16065 [Dactylosporangium sp. NBC_01737]